MPLAPFAVALPPMPGVPITCHVATWYWAARAAQAAGRSTAKTPMQTILNITDLQPNVQQAMLGLQRSGQWNFAITPTTPPVGSVLIWTGGGTHSAVVTAANAISGYNQPAQFPHLAGQFGYTTATPAQLAPQQRSCVVVSEATIINRAVALNL